MPGRKKKQVQVREQKEEVAKGKETSEMSVLKI